MHFLEKKAIILLLMFVVINRVEAKLERVGYSYGGYYFEKFTCSTIQSFGIDVRLFAEPYDATGYMKADSNFLFIVDAMWHRIIYLKGVPGDSINTWTKSIGKLGFGINEFNTPHGIDVDDERILYIADTDNGRIVKLRMVGDNLQWHDTFGFGFLVSPFDVAVNGNHVYVVDAGNNKVLRFRTDGTLECTYSGSGVGSLSSPKGIAVFDDCIYITDTGNKRIILLKDYGNSMGFVRAQVVDVNKERLYLDIETDTAGCVYVADAMQNKILKFSKELEYHLYSFGSYGTDINQFIHPKGLFVPDTLIGIIENWGDQSGFQVYKSVPQLIYAKVHPDVVDVTVRNCVITFAIDEYSIVRVKVVNKNIWEGHVTPGAEYTTTWDGRDADGRLCLPGTYTIEFRNDFGRLIGSVNVVVKGTIKSGELTQNEHWTEEGEPYVLTGNVWLRGGSRLTIDPGVKVMPTGDYGIYTRYQNPYWQYIYAQGNAINPIRFTPHRKLYPVADSIPNGFWKGIHINASARAESLIFDHCIIEGAGSDSAALWVHNASKILSVTNTEISKSGSYGLYCNYICNNVLVTNCLFKDIDSIPLHGNFKWIGEIYDNRFENNGLNVIAIESAIRSTDATIHNQGVPYWFLKGEFLVESSDNNYCPTLTVQPGVKIFFHDSSGLYLGVYPPPMRAKILAQGTPDSMIIFSALDTTKHWRGIHIADDNIADTSRFEYCKISYGGADFKYLV